jgi:hypothetical protein
MVIVNPIPITKIISREDSLLGNPSINHFLFYSGKITMFRCWGFSLIKAIIPSYGWVDVPVYKKTSVNFF